MEKYNKDYVFLKYTVLEGSMWLDNVCGGLQYHLRYMQSLVHM